MVDGLFKGKLLTFQYDGRGPIQATLNKKKSLTNNNNNDKNKKIRITTQ